MAGSKLHIALIGTRGVPANYGGFETCVEELGKRLVERGHEVTVYCRSSYYDIRQTRYLGMNLKYLPNLKRKSLDTLSHTLLSVLDAVRQPYDVLMVFNAANSPTLFIPRLLGKKLPSIPMGLNGNVANGGPLPKSTTNARSGWQPNWLTGLLPTQPAFRTIIDNVTVRKRRISLTAPIQAEA